MLSRELLRASRQGCSSVEGTPCHWMGNAFLLIFLALFGFFWDFFGHFCIFSYIFLASAFNFHAPGASLAPIGLRFAHFMNYYAFFFDFFFLSLIPEIHHNSSGGPPMDAASTPFSRACNFHIRYDVFKAPA